MVSKPSIQRNCKSGLDKLFVKSSIHYQVVAWATCFRMASMAVYFSPGYQCVSAIWNKTPLVFPEGKKNTFSFLVFATVKLAETNIASPATQRSLNPSDPNVRQPRGTF